MESVVQTLKQSRSVPNAKDKESSSEWCNLDLACTLSKEDLATSAMEREKSLTRASSAKTVKARKSKRRIRNLSSALTKDLQMAANKLFTEKVTLFLTEMLAMLLSSSSKLKTKPSRGKEQTWLWTRRSLCSRPLLEFHSCSLISTARNTELRQVMEASSSLTKWWHVKD